MKKTYFGLLAAFSFAAIANPDSSLKKKKPKVSPIGIFTLLEQGGKMGDPRFYKMMLISKRFNKIAENLTGKKAPLSFFELSSSSSLSFDFEPTKKELWAPEYIHLIHERDFLPSIKNQRYEIIKNFAQLKKMILTSSKGIKHLSFKNIHAWAVKDIIEILSHKSIQDTLETLTLNHFHFDLNYKAGSLYPSFSNPLKNLKQLRSLSLSHIDFQNQYIELPLSLETLDLDDSNVSNIPDAVWHMLLSSNIKSFRCAYSNNFYCDAFSKWNHLESLTISSSKECLIVHLPKNLKTLNLKTPQISAGSSLENLSKLEDLQLEGGCNEEFLRSLSPDLHPNLKHLKISILKNPLFFEYLPKFNQLETLILDHGYLGSNIKIRFPESLTSLDLLGLKFEKVDMLFPKSLRSLNIKDCYFVEAGENPFLFLKSLKSLKIHDSKLGFKDISKVSDFLLSSELKYLSLKKLELPSGYGKKIPDTLPLLNNVRFLNVDAKLLTFSSKFAFSPYLEELVINDHLKEGIFPPSSSLKSLKIYSFKDVRNLNLEKLTQLKNLQIRFFCEELTLILPSSLESLEIHSTNIYPGYINLEKLTQLKNLQIGSVSNKLTLILPSSLESLKIGRITHDIDIPNLKQLSKLKTLEILLMSVTCSKILLPSSLKSLKIAIGDYHIFSSSNTIKVKESEILFSLRNMINFQLQTYLNLENLVLLENLHLKLYIGFDLNSNNTERRPITAEKIFIDGLFLPSSLRELSLIFNLYEHKSKSSYHYSDDYLKDFFSKITNLQTLRTSQIWHRGDTLYPASLKVLEIAQTHLCEDLILPSSLEHLTLYSAFLGGCEKNFLQRLKLPDSLKTLVIDTGCSNCGYFLSLPAALEYLEAPKESIKGNLAFPASLKIVTTPCNDILEERFKALSIHTSKPTKH